MLISQLAENHLKSTALILIFFLEWGPIMHSHEITDTPRFCTELKYKPLPASPQGEEGRDDTNKWRLARGFASLSAMQTARKGTDERGRTDSGTLR